MSFKVLVDPGDGGPLQVIHEIEDKRVTRIGLSGTSGESGAMGVAPKQTEVLLTFEYAIQDGRPTLDDVEALRDPTLSGEEVKARMANLAELPSNTNSGGTPLMDASIVAAEERAAEEAAAVEAAEPEVAEPEAVTAPIEPAPVNFGG